MELIVILGGLVLLAGAFAVWPFLRRRAGPPPASTSSGPATELRQELEARYRALAELDEDLATGKLSTEDHSRLKAALEQEAAALLRREEASERARPRAGSGQSRAERRPVSQPSRRAWIDHPLALVGGAAFLLLLGLGVGLSLSWLLSSAPSRTPTSSNDRLTQVEQELRANPSDLKKLLAFGHLALDEGQPSKAIWAYKQVLSRDPNNVEAITHTGLLLFQGGHVDQALSHLDRALALDPTYAHALWDKANILYHARQDYAGAIKTWEAFLALIPSGEDADRARAMMAEAKGRALLPRPTASQPSPEGKSR